MKVLYLGVYRDSGGWAQATRDYILSLDAVGIEVVPRPIIFNKSKDQLPRRILELENNDEAGCDIVIQHILPHMMEYDGNFKKNIGVYCSETCNFRASHWPERLNLMDEVWVCSNQMEAAAAASGVKARTRVLPYSTDTTKFQQSWSKFPSLQQYKDSFLFYTISSGIIRKNLSALIRAFHTEFEPYESVELVIKTDTQDDLVEICREIKSKLKIRKHYKQEIIINGQLDEVGINRLHNTCDCFVSTSFGEAWCLPAFDAMGFGKTPIVPAFGGFEEYITDWCGWTVPVSQEPVFGITDNFDDLYTSRETWGSISIVELQRAMREAFSNVHHRIEKSEIGMERAHDYSYEIVGEKLRRVLNE